MLLEDANDLLRMAESLGRIVPRTWCDEVVQAEANHRLEHMF